MNSRLKTLIVTGLVTLTTYVVHPETTNQTTNSIVYLSPRAQTTNADGSINPSITNNPAMPERFKAMYQRKRHFTTYTPSSTTRTNSP